MEKFTQLENFLYDFWSRQISSLAFCFNRFHGKNSLSTFVARSNFVLQSLPIWLEIAFELWRGQRPTDAISRIVVLSSCLLQYCSLQRVAGACFTEGWWHIRLAKYHPLLQLQHSTLTIKHRVAPKKGCDQKFGGSVGRLDLWTTLDCPGYLGLYRLFWATLDHFGPL